MHPNNNRTRFNVWADHVIERAFIMTYSADLDSSPYIAVQCYLSQNLGDDLFLRTLLRRYPNQRFVIIANDGYASWSGRHNNLELLAEPVMNNATSIIGRVLAHIKKYAIVRRKAKLYAGGRALVSIGGSIFMEPQSGNRFLAALKSRYNLALRNKIYTAPQHTFICGANFGPYHSERYRATYQALFQRQCDDVCFRDHYSQGLFQNLVNVRYAPDILFGTEFPVVEKRRKVFFSLVDLIGNVGKFHELCEKGLEYEDWIMKLTEAYHKKGYEITYCSFCSAEGDDKAVTRLARRAEQSGIEVTQLFYRDNIDEVLSNIAESGIVIGTRFHATILGLVAHAKVVPVIYSDKTRNVLEDMNFEMDDAVDLRDFRAQDLSICDRVIEHPVADISHEIRDSVKHFAALDSFLSSIEG
jgi:colanic acid/amylovoran biosynthesis protein